jgi:hypothetical protein
MIYERLHVRALGSLHFNTQAVLRFLRFFSGEHLLRQRWVLLLNTYLLLDVFFLLHFTFNAREEFDAEEEFDAGEELIL